MTEEKNIRHHFLSSDKKHILMITNHGMHKWEFIPGLPDTGGQNVFVNQFTEVLADIGYKITIVNRGGYEHPVTKEMHTGVRYKDKNQRILYIEDDTKQFVRKEDMREHVPRLADFLYTFLDNEGIPVDVILSHYWDSAMLGILYNQKREKRITHVWVPHSLGTVKMNNMKPETWEKLRLPERIETEKTFTGHLDGVGATSALIREALKEDYGYEDPLFLPPCINPERFYRREIHQDHDIWNFLHSATGLPLDDVRKCRIISEISRTDRTKRKDVLIKAFAKLRESYPDTLLVVAMDKSEEELADELEKLMDETGCRSHIAAIGNEWERLPYLYSVTDIYCSPSVMEGFGMAVQEAAATRVPVVGSNLIPFVNEYLLGTEVEKVPCRGGSVLSVGEGAIVVPADEVDGFAQALKLYFDDETLRKKSGQVAYHITVPYFTWEEMTQRFLRAIDF
jgi:mannosylfructose-phosphate synthase